VAGIVEKWRVAHADAGVTIVVHLTRAGHDVADVHAAADVLAGVGGSDVAAVRLQHCVCPDSPHASLSYPATDDEITSDAIRALWQRTSPLADWEKLRGTKRAYIKDGCRALVVNGSFDTPWPRRASSVGHEDDEDNGGAIQRAATMVSAGPGITGRL
jgi:hypothetical protein